MARRRLPSLSPLKPHRGKIGLGALALLLVVNLAIYLVNREHAGPPLTGRAVVVDGDTIRIAGARVRLFGIDAPELNQNCYDANGNAYGCGRRALNALQGRIDGQTLLCARRDTDRYGRIVAVCRQGDTDINRWMVESGWALAYRQYSEDYVDAEENAHAARVGMWSGTFENPSSWRHRKK